VDDFVRLEADGRLQVLTIAITDVSSRSDGGADDDCPLHGDPIPDGHGMRPVKSRLSQKLLRDAATAA
jgi:hypothetical protein